MRLLRAAADEHTDEEETSLSQSCEMPDGYLLIK